MLRDILTGGLQQTLKLLQVLSKYWELQICCMATGFSYSFAANGPANSHSLDLGTKKKVQVKPGHMKPGVSDSPLPTTSELNLSLHPSTSKLGLLLNC